MKISYLTFTLAAAICMTPNLSFADGLTDLKNALAKEQSKSPIKASFELKTWSKQGEDKEMEEKIGFAAIAVEDNAQGLQLLFSRDFLNKLEAEQRAKDKDRNAKTPASDATSDINTKAVQEMTSAAGTVLTLIEKGEFKSERPDICNGKPARLLSFVLTENKLTSKEREHLKKYEGGVEIWIAEDGTPLAFHSREVLTASFLMVVSFEITNEENGVFALHGDRLVATHLELRAKGSGLGQKGDSITTRNLLIPS